MPAQGRRQHEDRNKPAAPLGLGPRLLGLVLLAILPALGVLLFVSFELRRSAVAHAEGEALRMAMAAERDQAKVVGNSRGLLAALANLPEIRSGDEVACRRILEGLLRSNPSYLNFARADSAGNVFFSVLPLPSPRNAANRPWFRRAASTREFTVGDYQIGRIVGRPIVIAAQPILSPDGRFTGVLTTALNTDTFSDLAAHTVLPTGASLLVVDGAGVVLSRSPDPGRWVGRNVAREPLTVRTFATRHGTFEAPGLDGVLRLYGCVPLSEGASGYVVVGLPRADALRHADRTLAQALLAFFAVALLALLTAWLVGRRLVVRPVAEVVEGGARALRSLRAETERRQRILEAAIDQTEDHVSVADATGRLIHWNAAFERAMGYPPADERSIHVWDIAPDTPRGEWQRAWDRAREAGTLCVEATIRRHDGTVFPADVRVTHIVIGDAEYQCAVTHDITERRRAEEELRRSEERYRTLVDSARDCVFTLSPDGVIESVNPAFEKGLGWTREEWLGRPYAPLVHPDDVERSIAMLRSAVAGEIQPATEFRVLTKSGEYVLWEVVVSPNTAGGAERILAVGRDITERRELEDQLRQIQKMEAVGRLAGGIAHDFNNLLTVIMGYTQLLVARTHPGDPVLRDAEEILQAATRASMLTRQLLTFSRQQIVQPRVLDLNSLVADIGKMLRRLVGEDIEMVIALAASRPAVNADPGQLEQVVMNLVVNARDAMPGGGRITIETSTVEIDESYAAEDLGIKPGPYVLLAVSDTGAGMDEATKARIFEPFFTTKEVGKGTGLGLSTVYGIVQQCSGAIHVYSDIGLGTTFKIYLPCAMSAEGPLDAAPGAGAADAHEEMPRGSETVLVVEDQEAVAAVIRAALEACGYRILEARHGLDAARTCEEFAEPIHLLITDVVLPMMGGPELVQRVRTIRPQMRVLYVSGYTELALASHEISSGMATSFLQKPFTPVTLVRKVRAVLDAEVASSA